MCQHFRQAGSDTSVDQFLAQLPQGDCQFYHFVNKDANVASLWPDQQWKQSSCARKGGASRH